MTCRHLVVGWRQAESLGWEAQQEAEQHAERAAMRDHEQMAVRHSCVYLGDPVTHP